MKDVFLYVLG